MPAITTAATGVNIVHVMGVIAQRVGAFTASDIDLDVAQNTPNSNPEEALVWIRRLLTAFGYDPDNVTSDVALYASKAQYLYSWIWYWRVSKQLSTCPDDCNDPAKYAEALNRAKKMMCDALRAINMTDPEFCSALASNAWMRLMGATTYVHPKNCNPLITKEDGYEKP